MPVMDADIYRVSIPSFEGPLDLLLALIARHKVDIYQVPLHRITDDYLAVLARMETVDLELATEFLVIAATLLELKAARLLPGEEDPEFEESAAEARDLLYARLVDYRTFKQAAAWIGERLEEGAGFVPREVPLEADFAGLRPEPVLGLDVEGLARLAARVLARRPADDVDLSHVQPVRLTVREAAGMVMAELGRAGGRATFRELTAGCRHPLEVVVHFLALLELYKLEAVELEQARAFGELVVTGGYDTAEDLGVAQLVTLPADVRPPGTRA